MAKIKEEGVKLVASNKKARHEYAIEDSVEAGLVLWGNEVKSLREGRANFIDSWVEVRENEAWLMGFHINPYANTRIELQEPTRARKLLLHHKEIVRLGKKVREKGFSLIPLRVYFKRGFAKVEVGLGKGKKLFDKRQDMKEKDAKREIDRASKYD